MSYNEENIYILKCLQLIEKKLNRGDSADWTSYDFEQLSEAIREATGVTLSVTTLKRIWGKLPYNNIPATTTLNTLAQFSGYKDWREFKNTIEEKPSKPVKNRKWMYGLTGLIPLLLLIYFLSRGSSNTINTNAYSFSSNKIISEGVPNSVIFKYDATAAGKKDSVFISQTWDVSRKVAVSKDKKEYSAIYYQPGYFRAKLIIGNKIVKEHDLMITSAGWVALIENNNDIPIYLKKASAVDEATIKSYGINLLPDPPKLRFINVRDMLGIRNDNFTFETTIKNDFKQGSAVCQHVEILILCKNDVIIIPLCAKACVGDVALYAAGKSVQSKDADLSKFGCDLSQWVQLKVATKNRHMRFLINGEEAYALDFPDIPTDIVGFQYRFNGVGAIKDTRLMQGKNIIVL
jgi:hypothetical protein